jgi:hypothetical protein
MALLSELITIRYRHPRRTPIQLQITGNRLVIDCNFRYGRRALRAGPAGGRTQADRIEAGVGRFWSGVYELAMPGLEGPATVQVRVSRSRERRSVPIRVRRMILMPSHVISPVWRRLWGIFKTGQLESMGTNWSVQQPGAMILAANRPDEPLERTAAHEAGHLFGLGDAYGAIYRFYHAHPGTEHFMMHSNEQVQPAEILMLLRAHQTGRMQFFPWEWHGRQFVRGLCRDLKQRLGQIRQRLPAPGKSRRQPPA